MSEMTNEQAVDVVRENNTVARFNGHLTTLHQTTTLTAVLAEVDRLRATVERVKSAAFTQERDEWHGVELLDEIRTALEAPNV